MKVKIVSLVLLGVVMLFLAGSPVEARTDVNLNIGINAGPAPAPVVVTPAPPPVYTVPAPPEVVVIPGTYVYWAPGLNVDILFYQGHWYRPHGGYWYRARSYNGPWVHVPGRRVPHALVSLPHDYRRVPHGHHRVPYGQLKKNWAKWEKERHWDRHDRGPDHRGPGGGPDRWDRGPNGHDHGRDHGGPPGHHR